MLFPAVKKSFRLLFDTAWGPAAIWGASAVPFLLVLVSACPIDDLCGRTTVRVLHVLALLPLLACTVGAAAASVRALLQRRRLRAFVQLLSGGGVAAAFAFALFPAVFLSSVLVRHMPGGRWSWHAVPGTPFPFALEYRPVHPLLEEYGKRLFVSFRCECRSVRFSIALPFQSSDRAFRLFVSKHEKRIVFPRGKRFGLWRDWGGDAADFAAYALPDGSFFLVDGAFRLADGKFDLVDDWWYGPLFFYRIDPAAETVEVLGDDEWMALPPDCREITGRWGNAITVETPSGERKIEGGRADDGAFEARRYLGLVTPGAFYPDAPDPLASPPAP
jgi:hypothetical protein